MSFKLVSCKIILRPEDLDQDEYDLAMKHVTENLGLDIKDIRAVFPRLPGDEDFFSHAILDNDYVQIMKWKWNDHDMIDISFIPIFSLKITGIISIDKTTLLVNNNEILEFMSDDYHNFSVFTNDFEHLRLSLTEEYHSYNCIPEYHEIVESFRNSVSGQEAITIYNNAQKNFQKKMGEIIKKRNELRDLYMSEFILDESRKDTLESIGYTDDLFEDVVLRYVNWKNHCLVRIVGTYTDLTYLLDENNKVCQLIYVDMCTVSPKEVSEKYKDLVEELRPRIHSFIDISL